MSFVQPQQNTARRTAGIGVAILFHIVLIWALMNGLARKVLQAVNAPIETRVIEEIKPPAPPPKTIELPPPPKFAPPPPAFAPPPEVPVHAAAPATASITTTATVTPGEPLRVAAAPVAEAPKAAPVAPPVSAAVACSNYSRVMGEAAFPRAAIRLGLDEGDALIQFTLTAGGEIRDVKAIRASHPAFAENSIRLVSAFKCTGRGTDVSVQVPFTYKSE